VASPEDAASPARRRRWLSFLLLPLLLLALDLARPPERQLSARALIAGIHLYRQTTSPWMPAIGARCRFEPTCSRYAEASIRRHGALFGSARALGRLARCGPWTPAGTIDLPH
jgi:putative membrane protein insertion efficiency factor